MGGYSFKDVETEVGRHWEKHQAEIDKLIADDPKKPLFSWLEGPPTANAPPALHHVECRVFKDVVLRFKTMQGYSVPRKGGWDCHGLPVEVQVEKKLKLKSKKEVLTYGIPRFIEECKKDVFTFIKDWDDNTRRLGFWLDLKNAYMTLSPEYMESVWWSLKVLFDKGLLYEGFKIVPYCPHCETPLSSHEVAQGYKDIEEQTVVITFKLKDLPNAVKVPPRTPVYLLVWTTTPWTLPANVSIAVHPDMVYSLVKHEGKHYILAQELVSKYFKQAEELAIFPGKELENLHYEPLFPYYQLKHGHFIMTADYVTASEGTGVVHQASAYGEIDYDENTKRNVDFTHPVQRDGTFNDDITDFKGMFVKDADPKIIDWLDRQGKLFKVIDYVHSYPYCWRCDTPLLYYAMDTWFVKVSEFRERLLKHNDAITWHPASIKDGRFGNWLEGAKDWALSRNKFWGTPLPVWKCVCGHQEAIGSVAELKQKSGKAITDLHIMSVDPITYPCPKCGQTMQRTPEVIDTWYDSGSAPFAQFHYPFENKDLFEKRFPYDFIVEAIDQTRGWFYTLHVLAVLLFDKPAYREVAVGGLLSDDQGEKMSKSKGNIVDVKQSFAEHGVDAVRMAMCSYPLGNQIRYGPSIFKDTIQPYFNTLWNCFVFIDSMLKNNELDGKSEVELEEEDAWIISRVNTTIKDVTSSLESHEYNQAIAALMGFVGDDLSRGYIKMVRDRQDEAVAYTFRYVFECVILLTAPFTPYVAEKLYQTFMPRAWSVHAESWPKPDGKMIDMQMEKDMKLASQLVTALLAAREKSQYNVRWPFGKAIVDLSDEDAAVRTAYDRFSGMIKKQTNVKEVVFERFTQLDYEFKPNYDTIGTTFGERTADVLTMLPQHKTRILSDLRGGMTSFSIGDFTLQNEHFVITKIPPKHIVHAEFGSSTVYIDTTMTDELLEEGMLRELTRRVQESRKEMGLHRKDVLKEVAIISDHHLPVGELAKKVGAAHVGTKELAAHDYEKTCTIKERKFLIQIQK